MSATGPSLSVAALFAGREAEGRRDREEEELLQRRRQEELAAFKRRLEEFELTNDRIEVALSRVRRAFERGDAELMITSFPSSFCSDDGRAIINAAAPPINEPKQEEGAEQRVPNWVGTMPKGVVLVYNYWKDH